MKRGLWIGLCAMVLGLGGCVSPAPLKGGKASTTKRPEGIEQTVVQSENPAQVSKQGQETLKVKTTPCRWDPAWRHGRSCRRRLARWSRMYKPW